MNALLYGITWLCWGGSWLAIKWQEGSVSVVQSIGYRFTIAGLVLIVGLIVVKKLQKIRVRDQLFCGLQALCLYSLNFLAFYQATHHINSGLVAVVMSTAILLNAVLAKIFWAQQANPNLRIGAPLGILGLVLLFWGDLAGAGASETLTGISLALTGTLLFSLGNMVSIRQNRAEVDTLTGNAWGMIYGSLIMFALNAAIGSPLEFSTDIHYIGGLLYLALLASVVAFPVYLALVNRIGASSAAYVLVATPVLALSLSSLFESYRWTLSAGFGVVIILLGNVLVLSPDLRVFLKVYRA